VKATIAIAIAAIIGTAQPGHAQTGSCHATQKEMVQNYEHMILLVASGEFSRWEACRGYEMAGNTPETFKKVYGKGGEIFDLCRGKLTQKQWDELLEAANYVAKRCEQFNR